MAGLLTAREREVVALITHGMSNRQIASRLSISARTVETHISRIYRKLNVQSRGQAAYIAISLGLATVISVPPFGVSEARLSVATQQAP